MLTISKKLSCDPTFNLLTFDEAKFPYFNHYAAFFGGLTSIGSDKRFTYYYLKTPTAPPLNVIFMYNSCKNFGWQIDIISVCQNVKL